VVITTEFWGDKMSDTFNIDAAILPEAELQSISEQIARHSHVVRSYRSTHYSWMDMEEFRLKYNRNEITSNQNVTHAMSCLRDLSGRMVYGFGRLAFNIATSFRAAPGTAKHDEYLDECLQAIDVCCYGYDGSNKFSTYVTISMQRRLINYKKRQKAERYEHNGYEDNEDSQSPVSTAPDTRSNEQEVAKTIAELEEAIDAAGLSELEQALVKAQLEGVTGFRAVVAQQFINPKTKKPISRMAAGYAYERALEKLRRVMERKAA
jgi:hypothetical protein